MGWKIVRKKGESWVSCFSDGIEVIYDKGVWTHRPQCSGPLGVFESYAAAYNYLHDFIGIYDVGYRIIRPCEFVASREDTFYVVRGDIPIYARGPPGTLYAERVRIF